MLQNQVDKSIQFLNANESLITSDAKKKIEINVAAWKMWQDMLSVEEAAEEFD